MLIGLQNPHGVSSKTCAHAWVTGCMIKAPSQNKPKTPTQLQSTLQTVSTTCLYFHLSPPLAICLYLFLILFLSLLQVIRRPSSTQRCPQTYRLFFSFCFHPSPRKSERMEKEEGKESMEKQGEEEEEDGPPPGWQQPITPAALPALPPSEMAQMVCGSCRQLLTYPRGARHVKCSCCQTVNFVLEAYQVGQVKCGSCAVLLMYPYGAPSVRCSSCHVVTEIGDHNRRSPWSVQQGQPTPPSAVH